MSWELAAASGDRAGPSSAGADFPSERFLLDGDVYAVDPFFGNVDGPDWGTGVPPAFDLLSLSASDEAPADEPFDVTLEVRNDGGRGVFRGAFDFTQPIYVPFGVSQSVEAETSETFTATIDIHSGYVASDSGDTVGGRVVAGGPAEFAVDLV